MPGMSQSLPQNFPQGNADALLTRGVLARRFCAFLIDAFIIGVLAWMLAVGIFIFGILTFGIGWLMYHIIPLVPFLYYTLLVGGGGRTPGQLLFGLSVWQNADLSPPNLAQAFVWTLLMWLSFVLACLPFAMALVGPRHRAAHDLLSGLVVIRN
jgi:uncharacterized RDD family membrane protein YckC